MIGILNKAQKILKINKTQSVSLAFVPPATIKRLNKAYRKKDKVTDVLSFEEGQGTSDKRQVTFIGEIIICPERAKKQAAEFGNTFEKEIVKLLLHGYLHLLGYDHVKLKNAKVMEGIEKILLE